MDSVLIVYGLTYIHSYMYKFVGSICLIKNLNMCER